LFSHRANAVKYSVITFGCRVNQADSLGFEEELLGAGAFAAPVEDADLVVVNTCSVTASADQAARQTIRRVSRVNPAAKIVVTGCYATRRPDDVRDLPNVLQVVRNPDKPRLIPLTLTQLRAEAGTTAARFGDGDGACGQAIQPGVAGRTAFTLRVQTGCSQPCSYCIIPTTRGVPQSRPLADILRDVERVRAAGFKEIAITGVHLGSYGRDLAPGATLVDLLRALDREDGVLFRISSLEPMDCTREIVDLVAASDRFAPHFHLPLQHASERMLAAMRRPYSLDGYRALVDDIRARVANASIGSDVIVGFPGETDDDFEQLAAYLEGSPLTHLHVFPYSDRPGTPAASMAGKVDPPVVRERARRLREVGRVLAGRFRAAQLGTVHRALTIEDGTLAVTANYLKVRIPHGHARNEWITLRLDRSDAATGEPCEAAIASPPQAAARASASVPRR
jgi:threonylcarbamoyladenosine tRNA methylthiotransferase MtaB